MHDPLTASTWFGNQSIEYGYFEARALSVRYRVPFVANPESRASFLLTEATEAPVPEDAS